MLNQVEVWMKEYGQELSRFSVGPEAAASRSQVKIILEDWQHKYHETIQMQEKPALSPEDTFALTPSGAGRRFQHARRGLRVTRYGLRV
jgi:hypothetical protein